MLKLKTNKTKVNYTEVLIVIGVPHQQNCPMTALCKLSFRDLKPADASLLNQTKRVFRHKYFINTMKSFFAEGKINAKNYSG